MTDSKIASRRNFLARSGLAIATLPALSFAAELPVKQSSTPVVNPEPPPQVTRIVAEWLVQSRGEDIPSKVRAEAVRSVVNWIGVTVGGSQQEAVTCAVRALTPYSGPGLASLFGRSEKLDPLRAALISGISSHVLDYDDTHLRTIIHPAGPIAASLFALSADHPMTGAEFLHAFVLGVEVECRLGNAIYPSHYQMGWHITGTCGVFGAAAACGKALGLDAQSMLWALGIAATRAAGLKIMFGTMCKSLNMGQAAESGLLASLLAAKGFTSSEQAIEGKEGYVYAASTQHDYAELTAGLGDHYEVSLNTYKPFACGIVTHPAIDGAIQMRNQQHLQPADIESIVVRSNPLVLQLTGKTQPTTGLESKFSIYHAVAVAMVRGYGGMREFSDEAVRDPRVVALRGRVKVTVDPSVGSDETFLTIVTKDGRTLEKHVEHAMGSLDNPLSNHDLEFKFKNLASGILPDRQADKLMAMVWKLETLASINELPRSAAVS